MKKRLYFAIAIAALSSMLMMIFGALALQSIATDYRSNISSHLQNTLNNVTRLVALLHQDEITRVSVIAADPHNPRHSSSSSSSSREIASWLQNMHHG